jgi:hypothetical protein
MCLAVEVAGCQGRFPQLPHLRCLMACDIELAVGKQVDGRISSVSTFDRPLKPIARHQRSTRREVWQ